MDGEFWQHWIKGEGHIAVELPAQLHKLALTFLLLLFGIKWPKSSMVDQDKNNGGWLVKWSS